MAAVAALVLTACAGSLGNLPRPPLTQVATADYVAVPFAPRTPPVEFVPPSPARDAVWIDGSWEWGGSRYVWRYGSWMIPPREARYAPWTVVRRAVDGQLFFAPSDWKDQAGRPLGDRAFETALGPEARARSRIGGPPASIDGRERGRGRARTGGEGSPSAGELEPEPDEDE